VQKWKVEFLRRAGSDPIKQRAAKNSVNSLIRQAKSLFAPSVLRFIQHELVVGSPFAGVTFEARQSMRYRSSFELKALISKALNGTPDGLIQKLPAEQLKIFLLAVMAGLRCNEIDKLEWPAFRWDEGIIRVEATNSFHPKTEDALGDVEIDPELLKKFRGFKKAAKGQFVIEASIPPRMNTRYTHYRCKKEISALLKWLRANGVTGNTPLHTLRKEFGSQMCAKHGIYAASHALRHADIAITSQHYLDKRRSATVGLGEFLNQKQINPDQPRKTLQFRYDALSDRRAGAPSRRPDHFGRA
jgi:integrase